MRSVLNDFYLNSQRVLAPTLKFSQRIYEEELAQRVASNTVWVDLGCGHRILPSWRQQQETALASHCQTVVGVDTYFPALQVHRTITKRVAADVSNLPFSDGVFDLATANMVVEHLSDPLYQFCEVRRILKPGGCFLFHTPNLHGYFCVLRRLIPSRLNNRLVRLLDGRESEDVFPVQYKANSASRITDLARMSGFKVTKIRMIVTSPVFALVPPLVIVELLWLRILMLKSFKRWRTNIIAELEAC